MPIACITTKSPNKLISSLRCRSASFHPADFRTSIMSSDHIRFFKSYAQRLEEYAYILSTFIAPSIVHDSALQITNVWTNYLELHLQPRGWRAVWNILRRNCVDLGISFPKVAQVMVENVNFDSLTAEVRIVTGDEDEDDPEFSNLPEIVANVPLKDLYVTVYQENTKVDANAVAEYIDQLRVFFHHLWYPWDAHSEFSTQTWFSDHLENRLKMYFDKLLGKVHYITGKKIKYFMERGEELHENVEKFFLETSSFDEQKLLQHLDAIEEKEKAFAELELIKMELNKLEIPQLRNMEDTANRNKSISPRVIIVTGDGTIAEINSCLRAACSFFEHCDGPENRIFTKIKDALLEYSENDTIVLCSQKNLVTPREHFDFAVNLTGLPGREIVICDTRSHWCLFECLCNNIRISQLAFDVQYVHSAIIIKKGCVDLDRVRLEARGKPLPVAIQVYENASLVATNCDFASFDVAIECFGRASIKLDRCSFRNNNVCLKVSSESQLVIFDCDMSQTNIIPIQLEKLENDEKMINSLSYMSSVPGIDIHRCKFEDESRVVEEI